MFVAAAAAFISPSPSVLINPPIIHPLTMQSSHEHLYDKLNNVHASLRKEKEDAHRTKQLAEQRLQLARADRESAEKRGEETRTQLAQLKNRTVEMKASNAAMEKENRQLEKEVCSMTMCTREMSNFLGRQLIRIHLHTRRQ